MSPSFGDGVRAPIAPDLKAIDVAAMPRVLRRIAGEAVKLEPARVAVAVGASLGAAVASLSLPRLFGGAVNEAQKLLGIASRVHDSVQVLAAHEARHALLIAAALVILATTTRGFLTMAANYQAEYVSQKVAYQYRLDFFRQLQRLSFGFHDKIHSGDLITRGMLDLEGARSFIQNGLLVALTMILLVGIAASQMIATATAEPLLHNAAFTPKFAAARTELEAAGFNKK